jgi:hypothetical protein
VIKTIIDRVEAILTDSTFIANCALASAAADFNLPQMAKVYRHQVDNVDQFPCAFVIYDRTEETVYETAGRKCLMDHRIYVGIVVQYSDPGDIESAVLGYIDALRPTLNSQVRNGSDIAEGKVLEIVRDPIAPMGNGRYMSGFSITLGVQEYANQEAVD